MKKYILLFLTISLQNFAQEFFPAAFTTFSPSRTPSWTSCATKPSPLPTIAPNAITFNVSGVGVLNNTTNALYRINIDFSSVTYCGGYSSSTSPNSDTDLQLMLIAPTGECAVIYNADWSAAGYASYGKFTNDNAIVSLSSVGCNLQNPNGSIIKGQDFNNSSTSNYGVYSSIDNIISTFNGVNANGKWTILVKNTNSNSSYRPYCMQQLGTSLLFGRVTLKDEKANGDACTGAIVWDGAPSCLSTSGKTFDANLPGYQPSPVGYSDFNGTNCSWNADNNNSTWVKLTPLTTDEICLTISGINPSQAQQSVIVKDSNNDGDNNPCTGINGTYWDIVSCPNGPIYSGTSGGVKNQTHCFTPVPGQAYYLIVDGSAGAASDFFLSGTNIPTITLPIELIYFKGEGTKAANAISWVTASEKNNAYFELEKSADAINFTNITKATSKAEGGNSTTQLMYYYNDVSCNAYYRLKQVDLDGRVQYHNTIFIQNNDEKNKPLIMPNPATNQLSISFSANSTQLSTITMYDVAGREVLNNQTLFNNDSEAFLLNIEALKAGLYFLTIKTEFKTYQQKIVKE